MKFVVRITCGKARAGSLWSGSCPDPVETPSLLLSTRKGLPHFLSPDLLASLPSPQPLHVTPIDFLECPPQSCVSSIGGLHRMAAVEGSVFVASPRDSVASLPNSEGSTKHGASFDTPAGRLLVKPSEYVGLVSSLRPNMWASLADEVPAWVTQKRNRISVDRTVRWLDDCLALDKADGATILGSIVGGSSIEERKRCATEVASRNVLGFWIGGFGFAESMEERSALLNAVTDILPEEKVRHISGLGLPEEVLQGVSAGIDLFDSTYIYHLTLGGFALVFPLDITERDVATLKSSEASSDFTKINLRATIFRKDTSPIVDKCSCFTCQNHTRAYINHLLNVHEMLAQILLEIHNSHHYLGFFRSVREAIKCGEFDTFRQRFIENRRAHLVSAVAC